MIVPDLPDESRAAHMGGWYQVRHSAPSRAWASACTFPSTPWAAQATGPAPANNELSGSASHHGLSSAHRNYPSDRSASLAENLLGVFSQTLSCWSLQNQSEHEKSEAKWKLSRWRDEENFSCRTFLHAAASIPTQVSSSFRQGWADFSSGIWREKPSEGTPNATKGNLTLTNQK